jgi:hypothetical protein
LSKSPAKTIFQVPFLNQRADLLKFFFFLPSPEDPKQHQYKKKKKVSEQENIGFGSFPPRNSKPNFYSNKHYPHSSV